MTGDADAFGREALRVMQSGPPSRGDDLLGMEIDFNGYLGGLDELEQSTISVSRTANVETLILVGCSPAARSSLGEAAEAVRQTWLTRLRYNFFEAHHLVVRDDQAVLRFITQIGPAGLYVTGQVGIGPGWRASFPLRRPGRPVPKDEGV